MEFLKSNLTLVSFLNFEIAPKNLKIRSKIVEIQNFKDFLNFSRHNVHTWNFKFWIM